MAGGFGNTEDKGLWKGRGLFRGSKCRPRAAEDEALGEVRDGAQLQERWPRPGGECRAGSGGGAERPPPGRGPSAARAGGKWDGLALAGGSGRPGRVGPRPCSRGGAAPLPGGERPAYAPALLPFAAGDSGWAGPGRGHGWACWLNWWYFSNFLTNIGRRTCAIGSFFQIHQLG